MMSDSFLDGAEALVHEVSCRLSVGRVRPLAERYILGVAGRTAS